MPTTSSTPQSYIGIKLYNNEAFSLHQIWIVPIKDLVFSAWNSVLSVMWQPGWEDEFGGEWIHVYIWLSH